MSTPKEDVEPVWTLFLLLALLAIAGAILWSNFNMPILEALRYMRLAEAWSIGVFTGQPDACVDWLEHVRYGTAPPSPGVIHATQQCFGLAGLGKLTAAEAARYYTLSWPPLSSIERGVAVYLHWFFAGVFAVFGAYFFFYSPRNKFKTKYNLESFIKVQARMWPVIAPIVNFKPMGMSARAPGQPVPAVLPPFAEALSPEEWVAFHRIAVTNGIPEREATRRAFLHQLGPRWKGIAGVPAPIEALFAAFALKGAQKRADSDDLLSQLALCWDVKKGLHIPAELLGKIRAWNRDEKIGGAALAVSAHHAFRTTALLGALKWARSQGGVLAPAQFVWLRAVDRNLWYPLNNLGRRSFHTEGAGALAHFMAEQSAGKPLPIPRIDTAIVTLNQYLATAGAAIPPREEAGGKRRRLTKK